MKPFAILIILVLGMIADVKAMLTASTVVGLSYMDFNQAYYDTTPTQLNTSVNPGKIYLTSRVSGYNSNKFNWLGSELMNVLWSVSISSSFRVVFSKG